MSVKATNRDVQACAIQLDCELFDRIRHIFNFPQFPVRPAAHHQLMLSPTRHSASRRTARTDQLVRLLFQMRDNRSRVMAKLRALRVAPLARASLHRRRPCDPRERPSANDQDRYQQTSATNANF